MNAGKFDRRVALLTRVITKGPLNADVETWPVMAEVWASYEPVSDGERLRQSEVAATITARFQVRWSPDTALVDPTWRLEFEGRTFDVVATKEIGRRVGVEISATARAEVSR